MWHVHFEFGIESGKFVLISVHVDAGLKPHIFDGSYNRSEYEFVMTRFYASYVLQNFELLYRRFLNFLPSLNKRSNIDNVSFVESGKSVFHGNSTAKCVFCFGEQQQFFEFEQSVNHPLTSGYNVDSTKIYKIPVAMLADTADVKSKFEFTLKYFSNDVSCESEDIKVRFEFVK